MAPVFVFPVRFLRMRDFDLAKAKEAFLTYLKWREDYKVDAIPKVNQISTCLDDHVLYIYHIGFTA